MITNTIGCVKDTIKLIDLHVSKLNCWITYNFNMLDNLTMIKVLDNLTMQNVLEV